MLLIWCKESFYNNSVRYAVKYGAENHGDQGI